MGVCILVDTNVLVSALISKHGNSYPEQVLEAVFQAKCELYLPEEILDELGETLVEKAGLNKLITVVEADNFVRALRFVSTPIIPIEEEIPCVSRDPENDVIPAYALVAQVDFIITNDKSLLTLKTIDTIQVVSPRTFAEAILT